MTEKKEAPTGGTVAGRTLSTTESYHTPGPLSSEAAEIIRLHNEAQHHAQTAVEKAIEIGERLAGVKRSLPHGQWMGWVNDNLPFGVNEAANYMRVWWRKDELNSQPVANLKAAVAMLAEPRPTKTKPEHVEIEAELLPEDNSDDCPDDAPEDNGDCTDNDNEDDFSEMQNLLIQIEKQSRALSNKMAHFNMLAEKNNATQIRCLESVLFIPEVFATSLYPESKKMLCYFGFSDSIDGGAL